MRSMVASNAGQSLALRRDSVKRQSGVARWPTGLRNLLALPYNRGVIFPEPGRTAAAARRRGKIGLKLAADPRSGLWLRDGNVGSNTQGRRAALPKATTSNLRPSSLQELRLPVVQKATALAVNRLFSIPPIPLQPKSTIARAVAAVPVPSIRLTIRHPGVA